VSRLQAEEKPAVQLPANRLSMLKLTAQYSRLAVGVVALAAAAVFLLPALKKGGASRAAPKVPGSIAVVAFENQTGDAKYDPLRKVIPSLLITDLENTGFFQVSTWERMRDALGQMGRTGIDLVGGGDGFDFCRHEGVAFIVVGGYTKAGETFVTEFKLLDPDSRKIIATAAARGTGEDSILIAHIGELSRKIASGMGVGGAQIDATHMAVADLTTRSTDAYAAYLRGMEQLDQFNDAAARKELQEAARLDPDFAIAHLRIGQTWEREKGWAIVAGAYQKALDLSARAPEKERMLIESKYAARVEKDLAKATAILRELVAKHPREKDLHVGLGNLLRVPDPDAAIAEYQAALALDPGYGVALNQMAFALVEKSDYAGAQTYLERYAALVPNEANPRDSLGEVGLMRGRLDEALANYEKAQALAPPGAARRCRSHTSWP
jgi:tetratricopeptide (TPR) repeat protein